MKREPIPAPLASDIEAAVVGALISDFPESLPPNLSRLIHDAPESCEDLRHGEILSAVRECLAAGEPVNVITIRRRLKTVSRDYLALVTNGALPVSVAEFEAEPLLAAYEIRRTKNIFADALAALESSPTKSASIADTARLSLEEIRRENGARDGLPEILDAVGFIGTPIEQPAELVTGILHRGSKLAFGGSSKSFKTWNLLDLAISVSTGADWLGFTTAEGKVLFVNFEIQPHAWQRRLIAVAQAKQIELQAGAVHLWNLRGHPADFRRLIPKIIDRCRRENFALIVLDPIYKLYGGTDENAAGDVAALLNEIERLATETGAAVAFGAHFAKGNASAKEAIDRISGSGVFARDPDSLLIFTKHEADDAFTVEPILRNFAPVSPFAVRWEFPLMRRADDLDPSKLKQTGGRKPDFTPDDLLALLPNAGLKNTDWIAVADENGISRRTFFRLRKALETAKKIHHSLVSDLWQPILQK